MDSPLLEIENLCVDYRIYEGLLKVVNGVNFKVGKGEKIGLVGESGCGKTTTMKAIMGILPRNASIPKLSPTSRILFKERNLLDITSKEMQRIRRRNISMIFQDPTASLNPTTQL